MTAGQLSVLRRVSRESRVNLYELGPNGDELLRLGLIEKDWSRNDASGESVKLSYRGVRVLSFYETLHS